jgi:DNA-binding SARP family transcriptional activator
VLVLRLLGRAEQGTAEGTVVPVGAKPLALLAYLRLIPRRRASRTLLADLLWSDAGEERARASLRQAVMSLRQACGEDAIRRVGPDLELVADIACDADAFAALARKARNVEAVDAYGGEFFAQFALPGARGFEEWALVERRTLHTAFVRAADAACSALLDASRTRAAAAVAERLVESDPVRERSWRLLLECRLLLGESAQSMADADRMLALLARDDIEPEPATRQLVARLRSGQTSSPSDTASAHLRADLVGRAASFSALLDGWRAASGSGCECRALVGDAGYGKTRLLEDLSVRLRGHGARVVAITGRLGERNIPFALLTQLASALVALPGAAGVDEHSAAVLVAMEPRFQTVFRSSVPERVAALDLTRRRAQAVADLLGAVSDERPVAVLVDDLHWADDVSIDAIAALPSLAVGARVLLVMQSLELLTHEGVLVRQADVWYCPDQAKLQARLATLDVRAERLRQLDSPMRGALLHLAVAGCPASETLLMHIADVADASAFTRLTLGGWIIRDGPVTRIRHDEIAASVLGASDAGAVMEAQRAIGAALHAIADKSDAEWRAQARLAVETNDVPALDQTVRSWIAVDPSRRSAAGWRVALAALLGDGATPALIQRMRRLQPLSDRLAVSVRRVLAGAAAALLLVSLVVHNHRRAVTPVALRWVSAPLAMTSAAMTPVPAVEVINARGDRIESSSVNVRLRLVRRGVALRGTTDRRVSGGVATFDGLRADAGAFVIDEAKSLVIVAESQGLPPIRSTLLSYASAKVHLVRIHAVDSAVRVTGPNSITVRAGASVRLGAEVRFTSPWFAASVMMAGVPTWGDRVRSTMELGPNVTPAKDAIRHLDLAFTAPDAPGRHHVILAMAAESDAAHIASSTNWLAGAARWFDGNDLADWGEYEFGLARSTGRVPISGGGVEYAGPRGRFPSHIAATVLDVVVSPPSGQAGGGPGAVGR